MLTGNTKAMAKVVYEQMGVSEIATKLLLAIIKKDQKLIHKTLSDLGGELKI